MRRVDIGMWWVRGHLVVSKINGVCFGVLGSYQTTDLTIRKRSQYVVDRIVVPGIKLHGVDTEAVGSRADQGDECEDDEQQDQSAKALQCHEGLSRSRQTMQRRGASNRKWMEAK